jgi:nicotinamide-nucleotide amidase
MKAEIITIGDELLIGQVIDTNSAFIGAELTFNGIRVVQRTAVSDSKEGIVEALNAARKRAKIVIITGGLGPTKDDITKVTLAEYFNTELVSNTEVLADVELFFSKFGKQVSEVNRKQALVPATCTVLRNFNGTAPGMWFDVDGVVFVSLPGVPYEMKSLFSEQVLPLLRKRFEMTVVLQRTIMTQGIGESVLAECIEQWEDEITAQGMKLAYLPSPGIVRLRVMIDGTDYEKCSKLLDDSVQKLLPLIEKWTFATSDISLPFVLGERLKSSGQTLCTAESCTGGYIAHLITGVPGSSAYYLGSTLTYANKAKTDLLQIPQALIQNHGAVSEEVVTAMAQQARKIIGADYALATSGIAGPDGGTVDKPVGTVWIALAGPNGTEAHKFLFGDNRERNITRAALTALMLLYKKME